MHIKEALYVLDSEDGLNINMQCKLKKKKRTSKLCAEIMPFCVKPVLTSTQASRSLTVLCLLIIFVSLARTGVNNDNTR